MRVISHKAIVEASCKHPRAAAAALDHWYRIAKKATWQNLSEVRVDFSHADLVGERTVFNIAGSNYRLITRINYRAQRVFVLHVLTHAEYDKGAWK